MEFSPIKTEGIVVEKPGSGFQRMPVVLDNMRPDEVLVEIKYSGICHTDIHASRGGYSALRYPTVLGHEGAGIIRAVGSAVDSSLTVGQSVILSYNHCGGCRNCHAGHPACCANFETLNISAKRLDQTTPAKLPDGREIDTQFFGQSSFLRYSIVSQYSVVLCPCPDDLAVYAALGCGFQTGAGTIMNALKPSVDDPLVIIGAGTVGIAAVMAAKVLGLRQVIAVDILDDKLALARELGATHTINSRNVKDLAQEIHDLTDGGARFAVECTGVSAVLETLLDCVCSGGTAVVVGSPNPDFVLHLDPEKMLHESKTLRGVCQGDSIAKKFIPEMIQLHRSGRFPLEKLCAFYSINDFGQAISDVSAGKIVKPILRWE
ncbi:chaperonin 10-like protein [Aspergillus egyptiacus]|nr:chaperonin 10-like protein [Aspergillus egyptiacus]